MAVKIRIQQIYFYLLTRDETDLFNLCSAALTFSKYVLKQVKPVKSILTMSK